MAGKFTADQFLELAYPNDVLNEEFLKKWNNDDCIETSSFGVLNPLELTAFCDYLDMTKFLVENGADITAHNNMAVRWAVFFGRIDILKCLLGTYIYSKEEICEIKKNYPAITEEIKELLDNYKKFSHTKTIR